MAVLKALASTVKPVSILLALKCRLRYVLHQSIDLFFRLYAILMQDFFFIFQAARLPNPEFIEDIVLQPRSKAMQVC